MTGLFGSAILDTAIGLVFVYLLLAIFCTALNEWIAGWFNIRANHLKSGIEQLLSDPAGAKDFLAKFYAHPLVESMMDDKKHPSYIAARTFGRAVLDLVTPSTPGTLDFAAVETGIDNLPPGRLRTVLLSLIQDADRDVKKAQRNIEAWYDDAMDRVSGWYKRHIQVLTIGIALAIAAGTNADTIGIARQLWTDPVARAALVDQSKTAASQANPSNVAESEREALQPVLGWSNPRPLSPGDWVQRILGWLLTVVAVSLGAPFWFDALNKFMNIRNAGRSPNEQAKTPEKQQVPPDNRLA